MSTLHDVQVVSLETGMQHRHRSIGVGRCDVAFFYQLNLHHNHALLEVATIQLLPGNDIDILTAFRIDKLGVVLKWKYSERM